MESKIMKKYHQFMEEIQYLEPPLVAYYHDEAPINSIGPKGGFFIQIDKYSDLIDLVKKIPTFKHEKNKKHQCVFQFLRQTREKGVPSVFDSENFGCPGSRFYLGFIPKLSKFNHYFCSTGIPGLFKGERFAPSPQSAEKIAGLLEGLEINGKYLIIEPIEKMSFDVEPEMIIFFTNPEMLSGLIGLIRFVTNEIDTVQSLYCSGCASIISWPKKFKQEGKERAVMGIFDAAARPYLPLGEITLSIQYPLFLKMLNSFKKSFLCTNKKKETLIKDVIPGWPQVKKRSNDFEHLKPNNRIP